MQAQESNENVSAQSQPKTENHVVFEKFDGQTDPGFSCGNDQLDDYYHNKAADHSEKGLSRVYVGKLGGETVSFATLSSAHLSKDSFEDIGYSLPFPDVPVLRIGMLAVDEEFQKNKIGETMVGYLINIAEQIRDLAGCLGVFVDAVPEAEGFYSRLGFVKLKQKNKARRTTLMFKPFKRE